MGTKLETIEELVNARKECWNAYVEQRKADVIRQKEVKECVMAYGDVQMKYQMQIIGEPETNGYPLYIALHGGGAGETPDMNDSQWEHMYIYYRDGVKNGIYINPRGIRDTWDTHSNKESFPLYDRLIENMIAFQNADPNRVYILGFSAGGDGVYQVAPRLADRFAATNMSAGHPNGASVLNLYNTPISLQVGMKDVEFDRHLVTPEYGRKLDELRVQYKGGYVHQTYVHKLYPHNFYDYALEPQLVLKDPSDWLLSGNEDTKVVDTNAIHFLDQFTRNPLPKRVVWDLSNRASLRSEVTSFYWLKASYEVTQGVIIASYHTDENKIIIEENTTNGEVCILLNEEMVDVFSPIIVETPEKTATILVQPSKEMIELTTAERGDYKYQFVAMISLNDIK